MKRAAERSGARVDGRAHLEKRDWFVASRLTLDEYRALRLQISRERTGGFSLRPIPRSAQYDQVAALPQYIPMMDA